MISKISTFQIDWIRIKIISKIEKYLISNAKKLMSTLSVTPKRSRFYARILKFYIMHQLYRKTTTCTKCILNIVKLHYYHPDITMRLINFIRDYPKTKYAN